ncbi:hypothetical protein GALMADRAFT_798553 [Galerina marginata CBS 339.88]|uniref:Uncharacterized protein n=1 Tax=Galerina marginata (strain CBS 339.88) TaxID=685588 RepID=A0A067SK39_GALM3|nr:hypothetical protein GALMADRAFT_798553 [Galerina marginata CBS 339.88]
MATVAAHYIDDHDPIINYTPAGSWTRGGNVSDYQGTSTFSSTPGATASITFSGRLLFSSFQGLCSDIMVYPKAQALAYGERLHTSTLVSRHSFSHPIALMVDPQRLITLQNNHNSNSNKTSSNLDP